LVGLITREALSAQVSPPPSVEWEETDCLLCGSDRWVPLVEAPDIIAADRSLWFPVVRCKDCGLSFTNPRPTFASIRRFYPAGYYARRVRAQCRPRRLEWLRRWLGAGNERKSLPLRGLARLLDFGCGGGSFLARMSFLGWQATGIDIAPDAVAHIRDEFGLRALLGTLPHPRLKPESFDFVTMWHSLEHVHEPLEILREAYYLLAPGGKLLVAAPNIDSLPFEWFGRSWFGLDVPRHLTHFSPQTLTWMMERAGFRVTRVKMTKRTGWLRSSATLFGQRPDSAGKYRWMRTKVGSRLAASYCYLAGRSDCMMVTARRAD